MSRVNITDRAHRYRANREKPEGPKRCAFCGSREQIQVGHVDGHEEHGEPENLIWICRSCNVLAANAMRKAGIGRLTHQYNPTKSGGAATLGEWMRAVGSITPHKGAQYAGENYGLVAAMPVHDAVAMIRATPAHRRSEFASQIRRRRGNPMPGKGAFKRCVAAVERGSSAYSPGGVCASAGRKKYGKKAFQEMALAGKRRAKRGNPPYYLVADGVRSPVSKQWTRAEAQEKARELNQKRLKAGKDAIYGVYEPDDIHSRLGYRRNPAALATEAFEEFHGHAPTETVEVKKQIHFHKHLAGAGKLVALGVKPVGHGLPVRTLKGFKGAILAFNEEKNQLFIEGGDQRLDDTELQRFGITETHEIQTLGKVVSVDYHTRKDHLGKEGGEAVYGHTFRMTNENGEHVVVTIARYPDLIYRVLDEQLEFSGGSYQIKAEGIDK